MLIAFLSPFVSILLVFSVWLLLKLHKTHKVVTLSLKLMRTQLQPHMETILYKPAAHLSYCDTYYLFLYCKFIHKDLQLLSMLFLKKFYTVIKSDFYSNIMMLQAFYLPIQTPPPEGLIFHILLLSIFSFQLESLCLVFLAGQIY